MIKNHDQNADSKTSSIVSACVQLLDDKVDSNMDLKLNDCIEEIGLQSSVCLPDSTDCQYTLMIEEPSITKKMKKHLGNEHLFEVHLSQGTRKDEHSESDIETMNIPWQPSSQQFHPDVTNFLASEQHQVTTINALEANTGLDKYPTSSTLSEWSTFDKVIPSNESLNRTVNDICNTLDDNRSTNNADVLNRSIFNVNSGSKSSCESLDGNLSDDVRAILKKYGRFEKEETNKFSNSVETNEVISGEESREDFCLFQKPKYFDSDGASDDSLGKKIRDLLSSLDRKLDRDGRLSNASNKSLSFESPCPTITNSSGLDNLHKTVDELDLGLEAMKSSNDLHVLQMFNCESNMNEIVASHERPLISDSMSRQEQFPHQLATIGLLTNEGKLSLFEVNHQRLADEVHGQCSSLSFINESSDFLKLHLNNKERCNDICKMGSDRHFENMSHPEDRLINHHSAEFIADALSFDGSLRQSVPKPSKFQNQISRSSSVSINEEVQPIMLQSGNIHSFRKNSVPEFADMSIISDTVNDMCITGIPSKMKSLPDQEHNVYSSKDDVQKILNASVDNRYYSDATSRAVSDVESTDFASRNTRDRFKNAETYLPYRLSSAIDIFYVDSGTDDGSIIARSETTVESTHPGSDDAKAPNFPQNILGSRRDAPMDCMFNILRPSFVSNYNPFDSMERLPYSEQKNDRYQSNASEHSEQRDDSFVKAKSDVIEEAIVQGDLTENTTLLAPHGFRYKKPKSLQDTYYCGENEHNGNEKHNDNYEKMQIEPKFDVYLGDHMCDSPNICSDGNETSSKLQLSLCDTEDNYDKINKGSNNALTNNYWLPSNMHSLPKSHDPLNEHIHVLKSGTHCILNDNENNTTDKKSMCLKNNDASFLLDNRAVDKVVTFEDDDSTNAGSVMVTRLVKPIESKMNNDIFFSYNTCESLMLENENKMFSVVNNKQSSQLRQTLRDYAGRDEVMNNYRVAENTKPNMSEIKRLTRELSMNSNNNSKYVNCVVRDDMPYSHGKQENAVIQEQTNQVGRNHSDKQTFNNVSRLSLEHGDQEDMTSHVILSDLTSSNSFNEAMITDNSTNNIHASQNTKLLQLQEGIKYQKEKYMRAYSRARKHKAKIASMELLLKENTTKEKIIASLPRHRDISEVVPQTLLSHKETIPIISAFNCSRNTEDSTQFSELETFEELSSNSIIHEQINFSVDLCKLSKEKQNKTEKTKVTTKSHSKRLQTIVSPELREVDYSEKKTTPESFHHKGNITRHMIPGKAHVLRENSSSIKKANDSRKKTFEKVVRKLNVSHKIRTLDLEKEKEESMVSKNKTSSLKTQSQGVQTSPSIELSLAHCQNNVGPFGDHDTATDKQTSQESNKKGFGVHRTSDVRYTIQPAMVWFIPFYEIKEQKNDLQEIRAQVLTNDNKVSYNVRHTDNTCSSLQEYFEVHKQEFIIRCRYRQRMVALRAESRRTEVDDYIRKISLRIPKLGSNSKSENILMQNRRQVSGYKMRKLPYFSSHGLYAAAQNKKICEIRNNRLRAQIFSKKVLDTILSRF